VRRTATTARRASTTTARTARAASR
jgi:hypothetical protein